MPNWAEGTLKIRGTKEDMKNFLKGALRPCEDVGAQIRVALGIDEKVKQNEVKIEDDEDYFQMETKNGFYIAGSRRAFIEENIDWWFNDTETEFLVLNLKQAWGVDVEPYAELSKKYNVDLKIYVFECGMEFNQDIEIHKGTIIRNNEITFESYNWDCIFPRMGG